MSFQLDNHSINFMAARVAPPDMAESILDMDTWSRSSDVYGTEFQCRTWVFVIGDSFVIGTIERYFGGLKMVAAIGDKRTHTYFFTEDGKRTSCKTLRKAKLLETMNKEQKDDAE